MKLKARAAVLAAVVGLCSVGSLQAAPLYQWDFNAGNGTPNVTAGGGTLTINNSTNGTATFATTGGPSGQLTDGYYNAAGTANRYNTADPSAVAINSAANVLTGLGTVSQFTVTMWINAKAASNSVSQTNGFPMPNVDTSVAVNARLMMLGPSTGYDEGGSGANGIALALNGNDKLQLQLGGNATGGSKNPVLANNISTTLTNAGQPTSGWIFVSWIYDGTPDNVFFDSAMRTATGNAVNNNSAVYIGAAGYDPVLLDGSAITDSTNAASAGSVAFGASDYMILANRNSSGRLFTGGIDDVRIYNTLLPYSQIKAISTVPEPTSLALLGVGGLAMLRRRRSV